MACGSSRTRTRNAAWYIPRSFLVLTPETWRPNGDVGRRPRRRGLRREPGSPPPSPARPASSIRALPSSLSRPAHRPGGWLSYSFAQRGVKDPRERQDTRYQYASRHRYESQPERSLPLRRLDTPAVLLRQTTGITTTFCVSTSFIRMNRAARLTGSISLSAAFQSRSYSSFRHRVVLRAAHLFSFEQISADVKFDMKVCGSGAPGPTLYIWRSE